jgi:hypothetical protein
MISLVNRTRLLIRGHSADDLHSRSPVTNHSAAFGFQQGCMNAGCVLGRSPPPGIPQALNTRPLRVGVCRMRGVAGWRRLRSPDE